MVKKNKAETKKSSSPQLTEWQRRNLEFQKKKRQQALEEKQIKDKLLQEKLPQKKKELEKDIVKPKKIKTRKKIKSKKDYKSLLVFVVSGCVFLISLFLLTPFSHQKSLTVSGITHTVESAVVSASQITSSTYLTDIIIHKSEFQSNIVKNDPWIKTAKIQYKFPNHFVIDVKENKVIAYSETQSGIQPILETGKMMEAINASELPSSYLTINLTKQSQTKTLISALNSLNSKLYKQIKSISLANSKTTSDLLELEMIDGNTVRVPLSELTVKLPYYNQIKMTVTSPAIVDMEVGLYSTTTEIESSSSSSSESTETSEQTNTDETASTTEVQSDGQETPEQSATSSTTETQQ